MCRQRRLYSLNAILLYCCKIAFNEYNSPTRYLHPTSPLSAHPHLSLSLMSPASTPYTLEILTPTHINQPLRTTMDLVLFPPEARLSFLQQLPSPSSTLVMALPSPKLHAADIPSSPTQILPPSTPQLTGSRPVSLPARTAPTSPAPFALVESSRL